MRRSLILQIEDTARFTAVHAALVSEDEASLPWLVTGAVLMAQQACVLALSEAGAEIPVMPGPAELVARVADPTVLAQPYTAPLKPAEHRAFETLAGARNRVMHPAPGGLDVEASALPAGLLVAVKLVRHLVITQPVRPGVTGLDETGAISGALGQIETGLDFWTTVLARG